MIPKFRAWIKKEKCFADEVKAIRPRLYEIDLCWKGTWDYDCFSLDDVILMQSTGLVDKNDQEIFEGDVVRQVRTQPTTENEIIIGVVTMLEGAWSIVNDNQQLASFLWSEAAENEIIGNIWEDGDLIDSKKTSEN